MSMKVMAVQAILVLGPQVHRGAIALPPPPRLLPPRSLPLPPPGVILQNLRPLGPVTVVQNSRLLRLPPELRNRIYGLVLLDEVQEFRFSFHHYPTYPPVLQVCQQIRHEALCIYFRSAHFEFIIHWRGLGALLRYLDGLDAQAQLQLLHNTNVSVHVIYDDYHPWYKEITKLMGQFAYAYQHHGPYITAEDYEFERADVSEMRSKAARVKVRAARRAAETKATEKKGADVVKADKLAAKAVKHKDVGKALLHRELGEVWDQIMVVLGPPLEDDGSYHESRVNF
ncbi:hypothetical protein LTR78_002499 [Recurvomyces mirabilis]|uniref:Uncharacterized protein n=1 Tax=Recurvomyces mirabilis TaxID=574656 RepID=A0AAE0WTU1_9PEZI|nr:hypothetical protein LTR78_002499 [Recurvomyces mirabilis]KAK5157428.1 hypothetical protein LTS14_004193 [Recurvomyces mirabilis]